MLSKDDQQLMKVLDTHNLKKIEEVLKTGKATYYTYIPVALTRALAYGSFEEAELLVKYGCDPHIGDDNHLTVAAINGKFENVIYWLDKYGTVCEEKELLSIALTGCIDRKSLDWFKYFVEKRNVEITESVVNYTLAYGNKPILEYILNRGNITVDPETVKKFIREFFMFYDKEYKVYLEKLCS